MLKPIFLPNRENRSALHGTQLITKFWFQIIFFQILAKNPNFQNSSFCLFCVFESICGKVGEIFFILVLSIGQKYGDDICFLPDTFPLKCRNVGFKQFEEYSMQVILCVGPMPPLDDSE